MKRTMVRGGLIALLTSVLAACGGGGSDGINGTNGAPGPTTTVTVPGIQAGALSPSEWAALQMKAQITKVAIGAATEITFTLTDVNGVAIVGLDQFNSMVAGNAVPTQRTVTASLAKLVPGSNGSPSYWVNYIVTTIDTTKATTPFSGLTTPTTDSNGVLTYLGAGQYKYKFARDITATKAYVDASTLPYKADVGDTTYVPTATHRATLQISGAARGTGTNTPDGVQVAPAVNLANPLNPWYDFVPSTGAPATPQRDIVTIAACNDCHSKLAFHGGGRVEAEYCVVCHTNQRKYAQTPAALTTTTYKYDDGSTQVFPSWDKEPRKYPDGNAFRDFPIMIHGIHAGEKLPVRIMPVDAATGQNSSSDYVDEVKFPQPLANCASCHNGSTPAPAGAAGVTPQGDNWKNVPSRKACGACHNNIDWTTGANHPAPGGARSDDSQCKTCHTATSIASVYHVSVDPTGSEGRGGYPPNTADNVPTPGYPLGQGPSIPLVSATNPPAGVHKFAFEIGSVSVAAQKATIKYRILMDGAAVTFLPAGSKYLLANIDGTPSLYVSYGQIKDGVASVVDWTASVNATVLQCRDQVANVCTQTGPDGSGYYTATFQSTKLLPTDAKLVTAMLGINYQGFVQLDAPGYDKGIRIREPGFAIKAVDAANTRRSIVDNAKCNSCHNQLGIEPSFHSGARNNGAGCATGGCHWQSYSTGHTGSANNYGGGWSLSSKNMVHAIHGASKRTQYFNYEATAKNLKGFGDIAYPGVLSNCEQCHVPGSYDFSASANAAAVPNFLWSTDADKDMRNPNNVPSIGLSPWIGILGKGQIDYRPDPLVSSPITSACFGCHDSTTDVTHMQLNGGVLLKSVSALTGATPAVPPATIDRSGLTAANKETCMICHGSGKTADIKVVHGVK